MLWCKEGRYRLRAQSDVALKGWSKMMFHWRAVQTPFSPTGSALALMTAPLGDHAHAEGNLDASYTISFARIRVGEITATVVFGDTEYAISARGRAGGIMKALMDGEGSFTTRGTITDGHPVPTTFTSKIVSNAETSDVTMVLDEGSVKELAATPPPSSDRVPVTEANRQGIVDPLTAMLFSAAAARKVCPKRRAGAHCRFSMANSATISSSHSSAWTR